MRAPRCSSGTRSAQRPRLPPAIDGDAERRKPCLPLNGWGRKRDVQSIVFFSAPGIEPLYSGAAMRNASAARSRSRNRCAPAGSPSASSASWAYDGQSKSLIPTSSISTPRSSSTLRATPMRRALIESFRSEAANRRARTRISMRPSRAGGAPDSERSAHEAVELPDLRLVRALHDLDGRDAVALLVVALRAHGNDFVVLRLKVPPPQIVARVLAVVVRHVIPSHIDTQRVDLWLRGLSGHNRPNDPTKSECIDGHGSGFCHRAREERSYRADR